MMCYPTANQDYLFMKTICLTLLISVAILAGQQAFAQTEYNQGFGGGILVGGNQFATTGFPVATYHGRMTYGEGDFALSANFWPTIGLYADSRGAAAGFELPVMAGFDLGHAATQDFDFPVGLFAQAGYNVSYIGFDDGGGGANIFVHGPSARAGLRFPFFQSSTSIYAGLTYPFNVPAGRGGVFSFGFIGNFDMMW